MEQMEFNFGTELLAMGSHALECEKVKELRQIRGILGKIEQHLSLIAHPPIGIVASSVVTPGQGVIPILEANHPSPLEQAEGWAYQDLTNPHQEPSESPLDYETRELLQECLEVITIKQLRSLIATVWKRDTKPPAVSSLRNFLKRTWYWNRKKKMWLRHLSIYKINDLNMVMRRVHPSLTDTSSAN